MATRLIRDTICTSDTIDVLSPGAEVTFYRLLVTVDDFGRTDANPKLVKSRLFPLKDMQLSEIDGYLRELADANLIMLYEVDGKRYLQVTTWDKHQKVRNKWSKYPAPITVETADVREQGKPTDDLQTIADKSVPGVDERDVNASRNPNPNPNPNPKYNPHPHPKPNPESSAAAPGPSADDDDDEAGGGSISGNTDDGVTAKARLYVQTYGLTNNEHIVTEVAADIRKHGEEVVKDAMSRASEYSKSSFVSLKYYRTCLENPHGKQGYIRHTDEEFERASSAAYVDLDG